MNMNKIYLLVMKSKYGDFKTLLFYTLEEAKITGNVENKQWWETTIIDLENKNLKQHDWKFLTGTEIITEEYRTNMPNVLENYKSSFLKCEICKKLQLKGCE